MAGIFNLSKVENAINNHRPSCVCVVDTNVLMNTPDPTAWKVAGHSTLFVVSDTTIIELEYITSKTRNSTKPDDKITYEKARTLIRNLANLFKNGIATDGIQTSDTSWVATVAVPTQKELQQELDKIYDIVEAFGKSDAKMLLLTKECNQLSGPDLVTLVTGEFNLHNIAQSHGIPCHLHTVFPIVGLRVPKKVFPPLDFDTILSDIQSNIKETSVAIELTLNSESCGFDKVGKPTVIAEGSGIIREMTENKTFFWTVKFHAGCFNELANAGSVASLGIEFDAEIPSASIDFADEKNHSRHLCDSIIDKLLECVDRGYVGDNLSLQPPDEILRYTEEATLFDEAMNNPISEEEQEEIIKDPNLDKPISWLDWISDMTEDEKVNMMSFVYECVHYYWKVGQTYTFRLFI